MTLMIVVTKLPDGSWSGESDMLVSGQIDNSLHRFVKATSSDELGSSVATVINSMLTPISVAKSEAKELAILSEEIVKEEKKTSRKAKKF